MNSLPNTTEQEKADEQTSSSKTSEKGPSFDRDAAATCFWLCSIGCLLACAIGCAVAGAKEDGIWGFICGCFGGGFSGYLIGMLIGSIFGSFYGWIYSSNPYGGALSVGCVIGGGIGCLISIDGYTDNLSSFVDVFGCMLIGGIIGGAIHASNRWLDSRGETKPPAKDGETPS